MEKPKLPVTCPLCGRRTDYPVESIHEGMDLDCRFCGVRINLHGHMWEEIREAIADLRRKRPG